MSLKDDMGFRRYLETADNPYAEVIQVVSKARELSALYNNRILHSEAITSAIHGTQPDIQCLLDIESEFESRYIREVFCYIDDKELCDAVYDSFYASREKNNLIYVYNSIAEPDRRARIRVLTRMLWYKLKT